jgi:hypothetical protein
MDQLDLHQYLFRALRSRYRVVPRKSWSELARWCASGQKLRRVLHRLRQPHGGHNVGPAANPGFVSSVSTTQPTTPTTTSKPNLVPVVAVQPVSTTESTDDTTAASITSSSVVVSTSATFGKISSASGSATTSSSSDTKIVIADYTTVRWYESWVGGTYSTWFPTTITVHPAYLTPAPRPGKGEIGMGTLTGELGGTSTIVLGAAPSQAPGWAKGVAAAVGVGIVGMVM